MPQVTVRDARPEDAAAIAGIWTAAVPYLVRSAERAAADLARDVDLGRRRWVGLVDDEPAGTATARSTGATAIHLSVEVRPDLGSRGVGTALLTAAVAAFPDATDLVAVSNDDPIALAFAVRNGFLPDGEHRVAHVVPSTVAPAGPVPAGLTATTLDRLDDLGPLIDAHNAAALDDPSGLTQQFTLEAFRADWWDGPDNAPELSWALLDETGATPVVASFTSVQVDRARRHAWSAMTATGPSYRGRGLARWVKQRTLNSLAEAGVTDASTANDSTNLPMLAVNESLGYVASGRSIRVRRRLHA